MASSTIFRRVVDLLLYHTPDRKLHSRLVSRLKQDPMSAAKSLSLWMWLESIGHDYVISKVSALSDKDLLSLLKETDRCFKAIQGGLSPYVDFSLPLTSALVAEPLDLGFFLFNRQLVHEGMCEIGNMVGGIVFDEGLLLVLYAERYVAMWREPVKVAFLIRPTVDWIKTHGESLSGDVSGNVKFSEPETAEAFVRALEQEYAPPNSNPKTLKRRTAFFCFLRDRRPLGEDDVGDFFNSLHGGNKRCVEKIVLERRPGHEISPVYGRMVFVSAGMMMNVMNGYRNFIFKIQGRRVWVRMCKMPRSADLL